MNGDPNAVVLHYIDTHKTHVYMPNIHRCICPFCDIYIIYLYVNVLCTVCISMKFKKEMTNKQTCAYKHKSISCLCEWPNMLWIFVNRTLQINLHINHFGEWNFGVTLLLLLFNQASNIMVISNIYWNGLLESMCVGEIVWFK